MSIAPLAIVQARMRSTRLPGKVMLPLADGRPILAWVVERAVAAFGAMNVVVATGPEEHNRAIVEWCKTGMLNDAVAWNGDEADVLGRFHHVAHRYRWHPDSTIVRVCCDDPFHDVGAMRRVASGERLPVELGAEAFTLGMLDAAATNPTLRLPVTSYGSVLVYPPEREHLTDALFPSRVPSPTDGRCWTVDTREDYERAVERSAAELDAPLLAFLRP